MLVGPYVFSHINRVNLNGWHFVRVLVRAEASEVRELIWGATRYALKVGVLLFAVFFLFDSKLCKTLITCNTMFCTEGWVTDSLDLLIH